MTVEIVRQAQRKSKLFNTPATPTIYSPSSVNNLICDLSARGWEAVQLAEGGCGCGDWVLIAPDDKHYNFIIKEVYLNEWSSGQTIRRAAKISNIIKKQIEQAYLNN